MKKILFILFVLLVVPVSYADDESIIDIVRDRGLFKVGVGLFEPWVMCGKNGNLVGYEIDVARKMAEDLGVRVQFVRPDWDYIIPALTDKKIDAIISGMGVTPERSLLVNFSVPYAEFGVSVISNNTQDLSTPGDFDSPDIVFGARAGTVSQQAVQDHFPNSVSRFFDTDTELLEALVAGSIDAAIAEQVIANRWLERHPSSLHRPFDELLNRIPEAFALRKGDVDGLNFMNSWIAHHRTSGWLQDRRRYWFNTSEGLDQVADDPQVIAKCDESFR